FAQVELAGIDGGSPGVIVVHRAEEGEAAGADLGHSAGTTDAARQGNWRRGVRVDLQRDAVEEDIAIISELHAGVGPRLWAVKGDVEPELVEAGSRIDDANIQANGVAADVVAAARERNLGEAVAHEVVDVDFLKRGCREDECIAGFGGIVTHP